MNSVRTGIGFVLLTTVYAVASRVPITNRAWSRFVEQRGKKTSKWLLTECQLASPGQSHIMDSLRNATNEKGKVECHLSSPYPIDIDGYEWPCILDPHFFFVLTGCVKNKATRTLINKLTASFKTDHDLA